VALAYAAVLPGHSEAVIREAMSITNSRWICGLGWKSDIDSGRLLGSVVYSRLSGEPDYQAQLGKARAELQKSRK
jgi:acid phosphatase (class A)